MTNNFDRNATFFDLRGKAKWLKAIREGATREELINDTFRCGGLFVCLLVKCQPVGIAVVAEFEYI